MIARHALFAAFSFPHYPFLSQMTKLIYSGSAVDPILLPILQHLELNAGGRIGDRRQRLRVAIGLSRMPI
jgi:hypothetical protein